MQLETYARTERGLVRASNEDAVGCFPDLGLFVVADGMGGHEGGELASRMAVDRLRGAFAGSEGPLTTRLGLAIESANRAIFLAGHPAGRVTPRPMGTTLVALAVSTSAATVCWGHVGDSRLYRLRGNELTLLTADHTRFGEQLSPSRPIPLDLPHTNELLAALGVEPRVTPAQGSGELREGDLYLLCSDGVSGLVPADELQRRLEAAWPLVTIGEDLLEAALLGGGNDNLSLILIRVLA